MHLESIRLTSLTASRTFEFFQEFETGLQIVRADNSMGKSTVVQGLLYGLGLDHMVSSTSGALLQHAMTGSVRDSVSPEEIPVEASWVEVVIVNGEGERLRTQRYGRSQNFDPRLVRVWRGGEAEGRDYFVRYQGAAQNEAGFHRLLAQFLGWRLPHVPRFDGTLVPLYVECLFPFLVVEQKRGWSDISATVPRQFRIRQPAEQAIQFLLSLESGNWQAELEQVEADIRQLRSDWRSVVAAFREALRTRGLGAPQYPSQPRIGLTSLDLQLIVAGSDGWQPVSEVQERLEEELSRLRQQGSRSASSDTDEAVLAELAQGQETLDELLLRGQALQSQADASAEASRRLDRRLEENESDLSRYRDVRTLRRFGSSPLHSPMAQEHCPTCERPLPDALLEDAEGVIVTSVDESITFLEKQRETLRYLLAAAIEDQEVVQTELAALRTEAASVQAQLRSLRQSLSQPSGAPTEADVERRLFVERRLESIREAADLLSDLEEELVTLSSRLEELEERRDQLRSARLSARDREKVQAFGDFLRDQLSDYGLGSIPVTSIELDEDSYRPSVEGFDLHFELSGSDLIRLIWSYMLGLMATGRRFDTNHPGFLLFDEPGQQGVDDVSLEHLLQRAATMANEHGQVVVFTSEATESLMDMLEGYEYDLYQYEGRLLAPGQPTQDSL
ncbi:MAG: hypothetical protein KY469_09735 [Actinobacteria bacterium]|nr:hypothetical protein [Actinomycetota bacterium]